MTKKQLRRNIIKYQNKTGVNKYDAKRAVLKDALSDSVTSVS